MSVGRVEMDDGRKQYIPYANLGAEGGAESEYVYIERFIRTETLLEKWNLTDAGGRDLPVPCPLGSMRFREARR